MYVPIYMYTYSHVFVHMHTCLAPEFKDLEKLMAGALNRIMGS